MKKFFASLTFIAFLFISQMQLVHALDMERMEISSSHNHAQIEMEQPIFCKTTAENNQSHCAKELVPDKALFEKKKNELSQVNQSSQSFSYFGFVEDRN